MAASTAALSPEITTLPALLSLATTQTPTAEPAAAASSASATSLFGADQRGHGALAHRHGPLHGLAAQLQQARGVGQADRARPRPGPNIRPGSGRRRGGQGGQRLPPSFSRMRITARLTAIRAGWAFSVRVRSFRPFAHQLGQLLAQRVVDFLEHLARRGEGLGQVGAHADGLAALSGKEEGDSWRIFPRFWPEAGILIPHSRRGRNALILGDLPV